MNAPAAGAYIRDDGIAERCAACTPEQRAMAAAADVRVLHPGAELGKAASVAWGRMPWAHGAWAGWRREQREREYRLLRAPEGPYHFPGECLSWLPGWQEGAVLSAWEALAGVAT
ncbi:FAD-dependent oxidoreductase [Siccirubricoccus phaeus]|uniref:FAD-dependent oxidoreductase n=1 Tax=Siccirubricoccus phaeus TaxID=2595053 RepID=UPI0011F281E5|nr:FAD-dependent oxidoreductase [Siccirubricoccus phaeus]